MTQLNYRSGVSIAEIIVYVPALCLGALLAFRHGFGRNSGWIFLVIFSAVRIAGAAVQLDALSNPSTSLITTGIILSSIGLSPLILTAIGLLSRVNDTIARETYDKKPFGPIFMRIVQTPTLIGVILCVVGSTGATDPTQVPTETKAGIILITLAFAAMALIAIKLLFDSRRSRSSDTRLAIAVLVACPFILCRLIYSLIVSFGNAPQFSLLGSSSESITIQLCMAVIQEFIVVVIFIATGLTLAVVPREVRQQGERIRTNAQPAEQHHSRRGGKRGRRSGGPIHMLVYAVADEISERRGAKLQS